MFKGNLTKDAGTWIIEVPLLDLSTFGHTKKEAYEMIADAIEGQVNEKTFRIAIIPISSEEFVVTSTNKALLTALLLKRQRGKYGLSQAQMAEKLGCAKSTYTQYEQGRSLPSISKLNDFLHAMNKHLIVTISAIESKQAVA